jgi:hypothetical protein
MGITGYGIPNHQDGSTIWIVSGVEVSFVPGLNLTDPGNCRMVLGHDPRAEDGTLVTFKTTAHELVVFRNVRKAPTGAV